MITKQSFVCVALLLASILTTTTAVANVWRVNNNTDINAHFRQLSEAVNSTSVLAGDTIHMEGSPVNYSTTYLSKRLVIIGPGYFLSGTGANTGLQYNPYHANFSHLSIGNGASGSLLMGISGYIRLESDVDNVTITRSSIYIESEILQPNTANENIIINKCMLGMSTGARLKNLQLTNNIITYSNIVIPNVVDGLIRNNVISLQLNTANSYVANNIFTYNGTLVLSNCSVKYNLSTFNNLPTGAELHNQINVPSASIFLGSGSSDGRYQLTAGSPARGAGEPIGGITPDCGAFGTADPYRLSGIAPIPTIYGLSAPASIPATATSLNITLSTRSNN
ncbi:MAG TPA: hypothetical protein VGN63_04125 [Flavisolibacter sp.]|jgi:hypothetical protein|nr:hypothetical protein [Flavisolibacter sp.]